MARLAAPRDGAREPDVAGYTRLRGALSNVGYELGRSTIQRVLAEHGLEPAPPARSHDIVEDVPRG